MLKIQNKSPRKCSPKKLFLKDSEDLREKHMYWSLFLKNVQAGDWRPATLFKIFDLISLNIDVQTQPLEDIPKYLFSHNVK